MMISMMMSMMMSVVTPTLIPHLINKPQSYKNVPKNKKALLKDRKQERLVLDLNGMPNFKIVPKNQECE